MGRSRQRYSVLKYFLDASKENELQLTETEISKITMGIEVSFQMIDFIS